MTVTNDELLQLLDKPASIFLSDATETVTLNLNRATTFVSNVGCVAGDQFDDAVRALGVWLLMGSYAEAMSEQLGSQALSALRTKLDHLRRVATLFINQCSSSYVSLDPESQQDTLIGVPPSVMGLTPTEGYDNAS